MADLINETLDLQFLVEEAFSLTLEEQLIAASEQIAFALSRDQYFDPQTIVSALTATLLSFWTKIIHESAKLVDGELEKKNQFFYDRFLSDYIVRYGRQKLNQITSTTVNYVVETVRRDMAAGKSRAQAITDLITDLPRYMRTRAKVILATESHSASQFASYQAALASGKQLIKVWNSVIDERTRRFGVFGHYAAFNHLVMNQTRQALTVPFAVPRREGGVEGLLFPGDPQGSAGNIINCRCIQTYEKV